MKPRSGKDTLAHIDISWKNKLEIFFKAEWENKENKPDKEWPREGSIKFENYYLKYREELDFVLNGINCEIKSGEKVI